MSASCTFTAMPVISEEKLFLLNWTEKAFEFDPNTSIYIASWHEEDREAFSKLSDRIDFCLLKINNPDLLLEQSRKVSRILRERRISANSQEYMPPVWLMMAGWDVSREFLQSWKRSSEYNDGVAELEEELDFQLKTIAEIGQECKIYWHLCGGRTSDFRQLNELNGIQFNAIGTKDNPQILNWALASEMFRHKSSELRDKINALDKGLIVLSSYPKPKLSLIPLKQGVGCG